MSVYFPVEAVSILWIINYSGDIQYIPWYFRLVSFLQSLGVGDLSLSRDWVGMWGISVLIMDNIRILKYNGFSYSVIVELLMKLYDIIQFNSLFILQWGVWGTRHLLLLDVHCISPVWVWLCVFIIAPVCGGTSWTQNWICSSDEKWNVFIL